jgi:REP element-mobilizing transposase RayT
MPRGARLDTPGTLHHVIVRGIERRNIVDDDLDRENWVARTGRVADDTRTAIYAWALMSNHAHMLLRSATSGVAVFMRRILTGHAVAYNRRHRRHGHLFQNRYKSIICEEDAYFTELVRYIHLNPLRAGLVTSLAQLDCYPWCGHAVVLGRRDCSWQDRDYVLKWFGKKVGPAKKAYRAFVEKGIPHGQRPELVGGGLIRSLGGWSTVKSLRRSGVEEKGDARILGSSEFVNQVLDEADRQVRHQLTGEDLVSAARDIIRSGCLNHRISTKLLRSGNRRQAVSNLRKHLTLKLVNELGLSLAETGRQLGLTTSGVAQILRRTQ